MLALTIDNLPDETHRALEMRARRNGRTIEAEIRDILQKTAIDEALPGLGSRLREIGRSIGGVDLDDVRDRRAFEPPSFK